LNRIVSRFQIASSEHVGFDVHAVAAVDGFRHIAGWNKFIVAFLMSICVSIYDRSEKMATSKSHPLEIQFRKTIERFQMLAPGDHVLVAVSGGADSTALLICLHKFASVFPLSLTAAHLNHRIRGAEADEDQEFVSRMCADRGIPFVSEQIEVKQEAAKAKQNLEEYARTARYDFLRRVADRVKAHKIAVGHNLSDQAETALFRIIRGSGLEGLSSIYPVVDGIVIRPLLECARDSIRQYLKDLNVPFREDSSNTDLRHARNRIRRELMPYLEKSFNPRLAPILAREACLTRETWSFIESLAVEACQNIHSRIENGLLLKIDGLLKLHPALQKQVLRQALKELLGSLRGIGSVHIQSILSLCTTGQSGDRMPIPHGCIAVRQFDSLLIMNMPISASPSYSSRLEIPGECPVREIAAAFRCRTCSAPDLKTMKENRSTQAYLELSRLPQFLMVRSRMPGDRYGGPGHRKVKKMLIDNKIPQLQRPMLPMIVAGNDVIWIPGFRPARNYEATPGDPGCVLVEMI
jgi:tRNA(Ile)-lysidine synthase